jgi:hypothetical protein
MLREYEHQRDMNELGELRSDKTMHVMIEPDRTWQLGEVVRDVPEYLKIHIYIFGDKQQGTETALVTLHSPSGEILMQKRHSIGVVT